MCKTEFTSRSSDSPAESQSDGIERPCMANSPIGHFFKEYTNFQVDSPRAV